MNCGHLFKTFDTVSVHETAVWYHNLRHIIGIHDTRSPRALISALKFFPYFNNNTRYIKLQNTLSVLPFRELRSISISEEKQ